MSAAERMPEGESPQEVTETGVVETPVESPAIGSTEVADVGQDTTDWQKQAKHHQRLHNQLVDKLGPLRPLLDQANGSQLLPMITAWDRAVNDPNLGPMIRRWTATGQVGPIAPEPVSVEPDPYEDEAQKAVRLKVDALERELAIVRQTNASVVSAQGAAKVRDHLVSLYQQYPEMNEEERASFESAFQARTASLHSTDSGQRMLLNMDAQTFKSFALPSLEEILPALIERRIARRSQGLTAAATDAPLHTQTTGRETTTVAVPKGLRPVNTEVMMQQALAEARRMSRGS